ncbi:MAG: ion transporter [Burkholderiales bacterium]
MIRTFCQRVVAAKSFEKIIIAVIVLSAILVGLETSPSFVADYGYWLQLGNTLVISCFAMEAALKLGSVAPRFSIYFRNGWNVFDFSILLLSVLPVSGQYVMVARLLRVLRTLRLISAWPRMRVLVSALIESLSSIFNILFLFSILAYIYAVMGYFLFNHIDPEHWGSLGLALLSLFKIVTLENWSGLLGYVSDAQPYAWLYFVSFIVLGTFVIVNLFIAVMLSNMENAERTEHDDAEKRSLAELSADIRDLKMLVQKLESKMNEPMEKNMVSATREHVAHPASS